MDFYEEITGALALQATYAVEVFNKVRKKCRHYKFNILTKADNCFHGNTKTKCNAFLCPMKTKIKE
jgi:hypothetical protein